MKHHIAAIVLTNAVASAAFARFQAPPEVLEKAAFLESVRQDVASGRGASAMDAARAYRAAAEARLITGEPWSSDLFQEAALAFLQASSRADALSTYERLEITAETPSWKAYAAFRAGELWLSLGNMGEASAALHRCLRIVQFGGSNPDLGLFTRASLNLAKAHRASGNRPAAIEARKKVLDHPSAASIDAEHIAIACVENARDSFALGDHDAGRAWFDLLFSTRPQFGMNDGRVVPLRVERSLAGRPLSSITDDRTVQELMEIWTNPAYAEHPESIACASNLATLHHNRKDRDEEMQVLEAARARFDQHIPEWQHLADQHRHTAAAEAFQEVTITYVQELKRRERWRDVILVASDLLLRYPESPYRQMAMDAITEAQRQIR